MHKGGLSVVSENSKAPDALIEGAFMVPDDAWSSITIDVGASCALTDSTTVATALGSSRRAFHALGPKDTERKCFIALLTFELENSFLKLSHSDLSES